MWRGMSVAVKGEEVKGGGQRLDGYGEGKEDKGVEEGKGERKEVK